MAATPLSRPAFYVYFEDIHELIEVLLSEVEVAMHESAGPWFGGDCDDAASSYGRAREGLRGIAETCVVHGPLFRAVSEAAPLDSRLERAWSKFMTRWDDGVAARIRLEQTAGLIDRSLDAGAIAHALNRLDAALLIEHLGSRGSRRQKKDRAEYVIGIMHTFWHATLYAQVDRGRVPTPKA
jgi:AcrR family transcriptional regulator